MFAEKLSAVVIGLLVSGSAAAVPVTIEFSGTVSTSYALNRDWTKTGYDPAMVGATVSGRLRYDVSKEVILPSARYAASTSGCQSYTNGVCTTDHGVQPRIFLDGAITIDGTTYNLAGAPYNQESVSRQPGSGLYSNLNWETAYFEQFNQNGKLGHTDQRAKLQLSFGAPNLFSDYALDSPISIDGPLSGEEWGAFYFSRRDEGWLCDNGQCTYGPAEYDRDFTGTITSLTFVRDPDTAVPEPASLALGGIGMLALAWARRRRSA